MELKDKVVLITGSSSGIGKTTALLFAKDGAKVVVNYRKDEKGAKEVVDEIKTHKGQAIIIQADVSKPDEVKKMFEEIIKTFGTVDILINNAGLANKIALFDITEENLISEFKINFFSMVYCAQEAAKIMLKNKSGKIINISSICGLSGCTSVLPFSSARSALTGFTKALAKTLAPNITVNAVAPGFTKTRFWGKMTEKDEKDLLNTTLTKKWVMPIDVAKTCYSLATTDNVTGQIIAVDSGYLTTI